MLEPNTEQSLPEIGTLKYDGAPSNPKAFMPINFNGLSLGAHDKRHGLGARLLRGFESLTRSKGPEAPSEVASGNMGVIRYNLPSPIHSYRIARQRRNARLQVYGRPLLIAACLAVAVPVGITVVGQWTSPAPMAHAQNTVSTAEAETAAGNQLAAELLAATPASEQAAAEPAPVEPETVTVKPGDSLSRIAKRHGVSVSELARANQLTNLHTLRVGQTLTLPVPAAPQQVAAAAPEEPAFTAPDVPLVLAPKPEKPEGSTQLAAASSEETEAEKPATNPAEPKSYTIRSGDTLSTIASRHGIKTATLASANDLSVSDTLAVGQVLKVPHADGVYVKIRAGESLSHLATRYGVKVSDIQEANQIRDPRSVRVGQTLFLPGADPVEVKRSARRERGEFQQASRGLIGDLGRAVGKNFIWPTAGKISSNFGRRDGRPHHGVDIPRPKGSPIHAAKGGVVIAAGWNGDYGKTVDISHGNGVVTRYAHCSKITVKKGDRVEKGELIALVGETGRASGPHLHYEVRIGGRPVNPTQFH